MTGYIVHFEGKDKTGSVLADGNITFHASEGASAERILKDLSDKVLDDLRPHYPEIYRILIKGIFKL